MKQLLFFFLFALLFSHLSFAAGDKRMDFSAKNAGKDLSVAGQTKVVVELKNLTTDTLVFLSWSCEPVRSLLSIDEEDVTLAPTLCYKNGPMLLRLMPHESRRDTIAVRGRADGGVAPFKLKINLVETKEKNNLALAQKGEKKNFSLVTDVIEIK